MGRPCLSISIPPPFHLHPVSAVTSCPRYAAEHLPDAPVIPCLGYGHATSCRQQIGVGKRSRRPPAELQPMGSAEGCWSRCGLREHGMAAGDAAGCRVFGPRLSNRREETERRFRALVWVLAEAVRDRAALHWAMLPSMPTV